MRWYNEALKAWDINFVIRYYATLSYSAKCRNHVPKNNMTWCDSPWCFFSSKWASDKNQVRFLPPWKVLRFLLVWLRMEDLWRKLCFYPERHCTGEKVRKYESFPANISQLDRDFWINANWHNSMKVERIKLTSSWL